MAKNVPYDYLLDIFIFFANIIHKRCFLTLLFDFWSYFELLNIFRLYKQFLPFSRFFTIFRPFEVFAKKRSPRAWNTKILVTRVLLFHFTPLCISIFRWWGRRKVRVWFLLPMPKKHIFYYPHRFLQIYCFDVEVVLE